MLTKKEFNTLLQLHKSLQSSKKTTQRELSKLTGYSLGTVNTIISKLYEKQYIETITLSLTHKGIEALETYRVENAIIMAAGMSSRFAPLSYEKPKGLLKVKGEVLIERQICQLQAAGISDITIVIGYMKEQFFYLEEKYNVKLVINEDYYRYNNTSTLMCVLDKLKNTYLCSSDNYFTENVFQQYEYHSYYATVYSSDETNEWCVACNRNGLIKDVTIGGSNSLYMMGHVYFDSSFSKSFISILKREYHFEATKKILWEELYYNHIKELPLYVKEYPPDQILEFDSLEELRRFDKDYLENTNSKILQNICDAFKCKESEITNITTLKKGASGIMFRFQYKNQAYIYRHPNIHSDEFANYKNEYDAMQIAKSLNLYKDFVYIDSDNFWKISHYADDYRQLNYNCRSDVTKGLALIKKLHFSGKTCTSNFDPWNSSENLVSKLSKTGRLHFTDFDKYHMMMKKLNEYVQQDHFPIVMCNNNFYDENILFDSNDNPFISDWKYAGMGDPYHDIGTFICCSDYNNESIMDILYEYHDNHMTHEQKRHAFACISLSSYHWYIWAIYQDNTGTPIGINTYKWFKLSKFFHQKALNLYTSKERITE